MLNPFNTAKQATVALTTISYQATSGACHAACSLTRTAGATVSAVLHLPRDMREYYVAIDALLEGLESGEIGPWWDDPDDV